MAGMVDRRQLLETFATTLLLGALSHKPAWGRGRPEALDTWARGLVALKDGLQAGAIGVTQWQTRVEALNASVPISELTAWLDIDTITRDFRYASRLADVVDPVLPPEIAGAAGMRRWFVRVFGMRRGGAIIPHVHNNMVSAHLVISGHFHARTHDRLRDLEDAVVLRETRNAPLPVGEVISMSDKRDNQHWLVAEADRSMTFDVGVVGLPASWEYGLDANRYSMIFVDPDRPPERDGTIIAPVLSFDEAAAKFAG